MKVLMFFLLCLTSFNTFCQHEVTASGDKAVVYFVRPKSMGALINFTYFDGDKAIGKFNGQKYMRYECDPGEHLFWARSENKDFVEADLQPGKIYMLEALPRMGGVKAAVRLRPVDVKNYKLKKIQKLLWRKDPVNIEQSKIVELQVEMQEVIDRAMEKYQKNKSEGKEITRMNPDMTVTSEDLKYIPK